MDSRAKGIVILFATMLALAFATTTAFANGQGHGHGTTHAVTEDDDADGHPNTPDPQGDTDNRHPSGKDRSAEAGKSGNQGKAQSDPDATANGGVDQPDGAGGLDLLDQDGNNGCGNDDDFEDDNNGKCTGKPGVEVGGENEDNDTSGTSVEGTRFTREPSVLGAILSQTGASVFPMLFLGLALMIVGALTRISAPARTRTWAPGLGNQRSIL